MTIVTQWPCSPCSHGEGVVLPSPNPSYQDRLLRGDGAWVTQPLNYLGVVEGDALPETGLRKGDWYILSTAFDEDHGAGTWAISTGVDNAFDFINPTDFSTSEALAAAAAASASADDAAGSALLSGVKRDEAEGFAAAASGSAANALNAKNLAEASATSAATQAGVATTQAGVATTQAGVATTQAGVATAKAAEAAASAASVDAAAIAAAIATKAPLTDLRFQPSTLATPAAATAAINARLRVGGKASVLMIGDSLTGGASGGRVADLLAPALRAQLGDGGPGLTALYNTPTRPGFEFQLSSDGVSYSNATFSTIGWTESLSAVGASGGNQYGFTGTSIARSSATATYIRYPRQAFTRVTISYLVTPGGGSFNLGKPGNLTALAVSCSGAADAVATATLKIWDGTIEDNVIALSSISGAVRIFDWRLENDSVGAVLDVAGVGGSKASEWAALDATAWTKRVRDFNPAVVILNLGTNDRSTRTAAQYKGDMQTIITRIRNASSAPILYVVPYTSTSLDAYQTVIGELVAGNANVFLHWWRDTVGENGVGYVVDPTTDPIHPNATGCALLAAATFEQLGGAALGNARGQWPFQKSFESGNLLLNSPDKDAYFTAATTNWALISGGSLTYTQNSGVAVTTASAGQGAILYYSTGSPFSRLRSTALYMVRVRLSAHTGSGIEFRTQNDSDFAVALHQSWATNAFDMASAGDYYFLFRPTINGAGLVLRAKGAATFTLAEFELRQITVPGQLLTATVATGSAVSLTNATTANVVVLPLPAGRWLVGGQVNYNAGAGCTSTQVQSGIASTSATLGGQDTYATRAAALSTSISESQAAPTQYLNLTAPALVYLVARSSFTGGTLAAFGTVWAVPQD